ncbi:uncharacterized protein PGTG_02771 [Puccinia graminis f. sp. tritici CRL 75-36-700-3]|uniref:Uncharacterized protein n=1 Tax=Puccinia graminis f. sp. tritici (strain CRL 75-36-700-3 / race SCCL) TaxID=418459 RepID=E3JWA5_PUCGT|nr:uncharacterized protein PGTG_02771 [Puccinia graminis f. sp. tritici CRL 75-36-700-3]EFP76330.1 hypothetical protein PGTG_02771 [Puccinia graminis f. sp. tritici CRL 75-36-700-3]
MYGLARQSGHRPNLGKKEAKRAWPIPNPVWHPLNPTWPIPNPCLAPPKVKGGWAHATLGRAQTSVPPTPNLTSPPSEQESVPTQHTCPLPCHPPQYPWKLLGQASTCDYHCAEELGRAPDLHLNDSQILEFQLPNIWDLAKTPCGPSAGRPPPEMGVRPPKPSTGLGVNHPKKK